MQKLQSLVASKNHRNALLLLMKKQSLKINLQAKANLLKKKVNLLKKRAHLLRAQHQMDPLAKEHPLLVMHQLKATLKQQDQLALAEHQLQVLDQHQEQDPHLAALL